MMISATEENITCLVNCPPHHTTPHHTTPHKSYVFEFNEAIYQPAMLVIPVVMN
jgi:hypothetical protein